MADAVYLYLVALNDCIVKGGTCSSGSDMAEHLYGIQKDGTPTLTALSSSLIARRTSVSRELIENGFQVTFQINQIPQTWRRNRSQIELNKKQVWLF